MARDSGHKKAPTESQSGRFCALMFAGDQTRLLDLQQRAKVTGGALSDSRIKIVRD
jgi:hypothetical protein